MPHLIIVLPPLALDRDFVDNPAYLIWPAYCAAAVAEQAGLEIEILDGLAAPGADLRAADGAVEGKGLWLGQPAATFLDRLEACSSDAVMLVGSPYLIQRSCREWLRAMLAAMASRRVGSRVLADMYTGGMHYLDYDGARLRAEVPGLDLVLRYEGERLLKALAEELLRGKAPRPGVREEREPFPLDDAPGPAWSSMNADWFFEFHQRVLASPVRTASMALEPVRSLPLATSRGCPYGCVFCTRNPGLPAPRRQRRLVPWTRVEGWLDDWRKQFDLGRLVVLDELVNIERERFGSLLTAAERLNLRLEFPNGLRADALGEPELRRLRALTDGIKVSLESASVRVQRKILGKNLAPESVERVARSCHEFGLPLRVHALVGLPGETREEVMKTLSTLARLHESFAAEPLVQFPVPLPGSQLAARLSPGQVPAADDVPYSAFQRTPWTLPGAPAAEFLRLARSRLERRRAAGPAKLIVNLTYQCNNRCVFCAVGDRPARHAERPAVEAALRSQRAAGCRLLDIDGGEPCLHPDLVPLLELARSLGYGPITLITNARRLAYMNFAARLVRAGVGQILVSLHGPDAAVHEALTRAAGSFAQTWQGLQNALAVLGDATRVAVNTTLVTGNLASLPALGRSLARLGVRRWNLQILTPFGRAHAALRPEPETLRRTLTRVLSRPILGLEVQVVNCPPCQLPGWEELAADDFAKRDRSMLFVGDEALNLQDFLAKRRRRLEACAGCAYSLGCAGDWIFDGKETS